jgi:light-regulated signal transduction histidine kinase (bacteriophytochrome)
VRRCCHSQRGASNSPAFGQADLTNCERELIHLAGSIQPHGVFIAVDERNFRIVQASANAPALLGLETQVLLGQTVSSLGGDVDGILRQLVLAGDLVDPVPLRCTVRVNTRLCVFEGTVHRVCATFLLVELEPVEVGDRVGLEHGQLLSHVDASVQMLGAASTIGTMADTVVRRVRDLVGYDRVMVYRFDPDGP